MHRGVATEQSLSYRAIPKARARRLFVTTGEVEAHTRRPAPATSQSTLVGSSIPSRVALHKRKETVYETTHGDAHGRRRFCGIHGACRDSSDR
jgi:hypothetical protein